MAPKNRDAGAKNQTGNLNSWLKTSSHGNGQPKRPRSSSSSNMNDSKPAEKKPKSIEYPKSSGKMASETSPSTSATQAKYTLAPSARNSNSNTLALNERKGDIFSADINTLIIHACNCQGSWGGGIALAFKKNYPEAFKVYAKHCYDNEPQALLGTALLIPPAALVSTGGDSGLSVGAPRINTTKLPASSSKPKRVAEKQHFVGCLFTSNFYGKRKDSPSKILSATGPAMEDLLKQVKEWNAAHEQGEKVGEVRMCKINSGLFAVPWEESVEVLEGIEVGGEESGVRVVEVVEREE